MRILICGGRDYTGPANHHLMKKVFDQLQSEVGDFELICGMANGADIMAHKIASKRGLKVHEYHAQWKKLGRKAGPIRNKLMLTDGKPDRVYAFPGGHGTAHMSRISREAGVPVYTVTVKGVKQS